MLNFKSDWIFWISHFQLVFLFSFLGHNQCNYFLFTRNVCCWTPLNSERLAVRYPLYRIEPRTHAHTRIIRSLNSVCRIGPGRCLIPTLNTLLLTRWAIILTRLVSDADIISFSMLIHHRHYSSLFFLWMVYSLCMFFLKRNCFIFLFYV